MNEVIQVLKTIDSFSRYECDLNEFDIQAHRIGTCTPGSAEDPVHPDTLAACRESQAVFLGPCNGAHPGDRAATALQQLCSAMGAAAHFRGIAHPVSLGKQKSTANSLDVLIVQEIGWPASSVRSLFERQPGAEPFRVKETRALQVLDLAFQKARRRRRKISFLDHFVMPGAAPSWQEGLAQTHQHYPEVQVEFLDWRRWTTRLVSSPSDFDVIVTDSLSSHVLEIGFAAVAGTDGVFSFASVGRSAGVYETGCNSPLEALNGSANPWTAFAAVALFLRHTAGLQQEANDLECAVHTVVAETRQSLRNRSGLSNDNDDSSPNISALVQQTFASLLDQNYPYHAV
jgi:3-isopropylmalate dehydrogenase